MLSLNEIRSRAITFAREHAVDGYEKGETHKFWIEFFAVFGIHQRRIEFEKQVKIDGQTKFIDVFLSKEKILIEQKSIGRDLDIACTQARNYLTGLADAELPKYLIVSDFKRIRLYDLDDTTRVHEFALVDLPRHIEFFHFLSGRERQVIVDEDPVNVKAAKLMGELHDELEKCGYEGHQLEVFLVRILFILFAEDTDIFEERGEFTRYITARTAPDGSDLGRALSEIFEVLNTPSERRMTTLDEELRRFPYINGKLFAEHLGTTGFTSAMRDKLLKCCDFDWGEISPAVFGSLFQYVMDPKERRDLGAHYTDEKNILKVIKPLFLDDLWAIFERVKGSPKGLRELHDKLAGLKFFDPACGCGNFLVITYREIRLLELAILKRLYPMLHTERDNVASFNIKNLVKIDVDHFFGIEIGEFSAEVAKVSMWLMDHQMNRRVSRELGHSFARIPLSAAANILHANALRIDWHEVLPASECSYIVSNPPFYGKQLQTKEQKEDMDRVFEGVKGAGVLDYVTCWYVKAAHYIQRTDIEVGFVSTNSITQGEQVGILWGELLRRYGVKINFAHQTFKWNNQASGKAQVFVVIIGFGLSERKEKWLYEYDEVRGEAHERKVKNINPYLVEGNAITIAKRSRSICDVPEVNYGSFALDDGNYTLSEADRDEILQESASSQSFIKPFIGGRELLHSERRYCLWLLGADPIAIRCNKKILDRVDAVRKWRSNSNRGTTKKLADTPTIFAEIRQPTTKYLAFPTLSSEKRKYIPIAFLTPDIIASNQVYIIPDSTTYHFGILSSAMHMAWVKYVGGRFKSDYRYSSAIVYNNFPWPQDVSEEKKKKVEAAAQQVLDTRAKYPECSLADLYDPLTMPPDLVRAHTDLDRAVDLCYRPQPFESESARVAFLFERYEELTAPLTKALAKRG